MSDQGRSAGRAVRAVLILSAVITAAAQAPPDEQGEVGGAVQVLKCQVEQALPTPPAEAGQGGFRFVFESLGGTAVDGRACTVYRLRNTRGSPPTPVRWSAGSEVLADVAGLPRCPPDAECEWMEIARYFDGDFVHGDTLVSYGLNADSFHEESPGLVAFASPDTAAVAASVGTEVVGTVEAPGGHRVAVDLVVKSRIERAEGGALLIYEVTAADESQLDGSRFTLAWEAFDLLPAGSLPAPEGASPFRTLETGEVVGADRDGDTVRVTLLTGPVAYIDPLHLVLRDAETGAALMRVHMPAFLPRGR